MDAQVLTTSCKDAFAAVRSACGADNLGAFENKCKSTTYSFEGPIRIGCVSGAN